MTNPDTPNDGGGAPQQASVVGKPIPPVDGKHQTLEDVLTDGEEPTQELLEEIDALEHATPLSDEELARQALEHPGADGDPSTPE